MAETKVAKKPTVKQAALLAALVRGRILREVTDANNKVTLAVCSPKGTLPEGKPTKTDAATLASCLDRGWLQALPAVQDSKTWGITDEGAKARKIK